MNRRWFTIGSDLYNESGINQPRRRHSLPLTPLPDAVQSSTSVHPGNQFSIFSNDDFTKLWSAGLNISGECCISSNQTEIEQFTEITYFNRNNIRLRTISVNPMTNTAFFICQKGDLYGAGDNLRGLLGTESQFKFVSEPLLIDSLQNVLDAMTSSFKYSVALCLSPVEDPMSIINAINEWYKTSEIEPIDFPLDISNEIIGFMASTKVYCTKRISMGMLSRNRKGGWIEMKRVKPFGEGQIMTSSIVKVSMTGEGDTILVDGDGNLWEMESPSYHSPTNASNQMDYVYRKNEYFSRRSIRIKDVQCGANHVLVLSEDGIAYSWGMNVFGQCGNGNTSHVVSENPHCIHIEDVKSIRCGYLHCSVKTQNGEHFMFGCNSNAECLAFTEGDSVPYPYRLERGVIGKLGIEKIIEVYPGHSNTKLMCEVISSLS